MSELPGISVVIPTMCPRFLARCLKGLARQVDRRFEVIVVENGCRGGAESTMLDFNDALEVRYLFEPEAGGNRARNRGAAAARLDVLAFLDDDCVPAPQWIRAIRTNRAVVDGEVVAGGVVRAQFLRRPPSWFQGLFRETISELDLGPQARMIRDSEYIVSANMFLAAAVLRQAGGFSETLGVRGRQAPQLGNDEVELIRRLAREGVPTAWDPSAVVRHIVPPERTTLESIALRRYGQGLSDIMLMGLETPGLQLADLWRRLHEEANREDWQRRFDAVRAAMSPADAAVFDANLRVARTAYLAGLARAVLGRQRRSAGVGVSRMPEGVGDDIAAASAEGWSASLARLHQELGATPPLSVAGHPAVGLPGGNGA